MVAAAEKVRLGPEFRLRAFRRAAATVKHSLRPTRKREAFRLKAGRRVQMRAVNPPDLILNLAVKKNSETNLIGTINRRWNQRCQLARHKFYSIMKQIHSTTQSVTQELYFECFTCESAVRECAACCRTRPKETTFTPLAAAAEPL